MSTMTITAARARYQASSHTRSDWVAYVTAVEHIRTSTKERSMTTITETIRAEAKAAARAEIEAFWAEHGDRIVWVNDIAVLV